MKKKRFYNNKKRNSKWTEPVTGRKIDFADKYIDAGTGSDKFDKKRPKKRKKIFTAEKAAKWIKSIVIAVCCFLIISVGYAAMDLYMERNAMPESENSQQDESGISNLSINITSLAVQPLSLDGGIMLDAVINNAQAKGYSSITFDLKRDDGTIGYESKLATIDAYGAISSASADLEGSVSKLLQSDLLPVARISCYKDNIAPTADLNAAVTKGTGIYKDSSGNSYLNPDSEITYSYIKGIIEEANGMGITVFVLDNTELPDDIKGNHTDGFDNLIKKLYADFGDDIKLLSAVGIDAFASKDDTFEDGTDDTEEYTGEESTEVSKSTDSFEEELSREIENNTSENTVYFISTNREEEVKKYLDAKNITNYIIVVREDV